MSELEQIRELATTLKGMIANVSQILDRETTYKEGYQNLKKEVNEKLMKQCEVAKMLGISDATVLKARRAKKIKAVLIGKTWKYPLCEVVRYKSRKY